MAKPSLAILVPGTHLYIEHYVRNVVRHVKSVDVVNTRAGYFVVHVRLAWWTWFAWGFIHRRAKRLIENNADKWKAVGTSATVIVD